MSTALWLVWRELASRRARLALSAGAVAAAVALCIGTELVSRAREEAVAAQLDQIGPPLRIVPEGVSASALSRYDLGERMLPAGVIDRVRRTVGSLRAVEGRLIFEGLVAGHIAQIIGVPSDTRSPVMTFASLQPGEVALGAALAESAGAKLGDVVAVGRERFRVAALLPSTGSADDLAAYVPLSTLQELVGVPGALNEVRLYLRAGASARAAEAALRTASLGAQVIRADRGDVAERGVQESLERHRRLVYAITAVVAGVCLLIASHLDASERRIEMATLVAMGGSGMNVLLAILLRSALVSGLGATAGLAIGASAALATGAGVSAIAGAAWLLGLFGIGAVGLGMLAAGPVALLSARRDPVPDLQEG